MNTVTHMAQQLPTLDDLPLRLNSVTMAQLQLFDTEPRPAVTRPPDDYWRPGMVTSLPMFAVLDGVRQYAYCVPGVVETIDADTANVRVYSHPAYTGTEESAQHGKLATGVELAELGRYALCGHLQAIADAGKLVTGDLELVERRKLTARQNAEQRQRERLAEEAARRAVQQDRLEAGAFIECGSYEHAFEWTRNDPTPAKAGDGRKYLLRTDMGAVQINLTFPRLGEPCPWGSAAYGHSISSTGYKSLLSEWRPTSEDFERPFDAAQRVASGLQRGHRRMRARDFLEVRHG